MTTEEHISGAFDKDLRLIEDLVVRMGGLVEQQIDDASQLLTTRDLDKADKLRASDKAVDSLQEDIEHHVVRLIALRQPKAQDLRCALAAMKVAADLERIGDYAKNIAKRTHVLAQVPAVGDSARVIQRMCSMVRSMVKDALDAYIARDSDKADNVRLRDEEVDQVHTSLFQDLLQHMMEDSTHITCSMHLLFISKNVERMGDHITSIAEQIHYLVCGEMPEDDRPKGDTTSTTMPPEIIDSK